MVQCTKSTNLSFHIPLAIEDNISAGAIAGCVIGGIVLFGIIVCCVAVKRKQLQTQQDARSFSRAGERK